MTRRTPQYRGGIPVWTNEGHRFQLGTFSRYASKRLLTPHSANRVKRISISIHNTNCSSTHKQKTNQIWSELSTCRSIKFIHFLFKLLISKYVDKIIDNIIFKLKTILIWYFKKNLLLPSPKCPLKSFTRLSYSNNNFWSGCVILLHCMDLWNQ